MKEVAEYLFYSANDERENCETSSLDVSSGRSEGTSAVCKSIT